MRGKFSLYRRSSLLEHHSFKLGCCYLLFKKDCAIKMICSEEDAMNQSCFTRAKYARFVYCVNIFFLVHQRCCQKVTGADRHVNL
jgi:hypothetical protein